MAGVRYLLARTELTGNATSVTFSNIPQTGYTDLRLVASIRTDRTASNAENIRLQFNGDTTSVYSARILEGNGSAASSSSNSAQASILSGYGDTDADTASTFGNYEIYIPNYTSSNAKSISSDSVVENNATLGYNVMIAGLWNPSTQAAITSINLFPQLGPNFKQYSSFSLYGIKAS